MASVFGKMQLTLIDYPSGRFGFVGSVPRELAIDADEKCRVWENADAARHEAKRLDFTFAECITKGKP